MAELDLQAAVAELYGAPLEAFVDERRRLVKELRGAGDKRAAAKIAKLPKPTAAAWALNHVAREAPDVVERWLETAADLREATERVAELGGDAVRAASAAHRAATARVVASVRERARPGGRTLSEPLLDRVRALLSAATADGALAERLRAGRVTEDRATPQASEFPPPPARGRDEAAAAAGASAAARDREARARAQRRAELEAQATAALAEVERRHAEGARREAAAASAEQRLEEACRRLHRSRSEAEAARDAVADAERELAAGEQELERLRTLLRRDDH